MSRLGTIRRTIVSSKYFFRVSETSDAVVCGASLGSSLIENVPQDVSNVSVYVFFGSSRCLGGWRIAGSRASGASTVSQVVGDELAPVPTAFEDLFAPPQPAASRSTAIATSALRIRAIVSTPYGTNPLRMGCRDRPPLRDLPRRGVGRPVPRRHASLRAPDTRRGAGGALLVDDPAQTRGLSSSVRGVRSRGGRALHREGRRAASRRRRDRAQPDEDRVGGHERGARPRGAGR